MYLRRHFAVAFVLGCGLLGGCISPFKSSPTTVAKPVDDPAGAIGDPNDPLPRLKAFLAGEGLSTNPARPGEASRLVAVWDPHITFAPDSTRGGDPVPGLVGRLWIFGPDVKEPIEPDGELIVGVWDQSPKTSDGASKLLEVWHIDREASKKFRKVDMWGSGYSLFLPWQKYNVDLKQVNVQVRFNGADGRNLVAPSQVLNLDHSATLQRAAEKLGLHTTASAPPNQLPTLPAPTLRPWPETGPQK